MTAEGKVPADYVSRKGDVFEAQYASIRVVDTVDGRVRVEVRINNEHDCFEETTVEHFADTMQHAVNHFTLTRAPE